MIAMETLLKLSRKYGGRIQAMAGPLAEARGWLEMEAARLEGRPQMPNRGSLTGCGCYREHLAVRADGVITPCTMLSHIELGRVNGDDLGDIWKNHAELKVCGKAPSSRFPVLPSARGANTSLTARGTVPACPTRIQAR